MAYVVIVVNVLDGLDPATSVQSIASNYSIQSDGETNLNKIMNLLSGVVGGTVNANTQILIRDTDPVVALSGTASVSIPNNFS